MPRRETAKSDEKTETPLGVSVFYAPMGLRLLPPQVRAWQEARGQSTGGIISD